MKIRPSSYPRRKTFDYKKPSLPLYLSVKNNLFGSCDGPLTLKTTVEIKQARFCLHSRVQASFSMCRSTPVCWKTWLEEEQFYINCSHRSCKVNGYIAMKEVTNKGAGEQTYKTFTMPRMKDPGDSKGVGMLFQLHVLEKGQRKDTVEETQAMTSEDSTPEAPNSMTVVEISDGNVPSENRSSSLSNSHSPVNRSPKKTTESPEIEPTSPSRDSARELPIDTTEYPESVATSPSLSTESRDSFIFTKESSNLPTVGLLTSSSPQAMSSNAPMPFIGEPLTHAAQRSKDKQVQHAPLVGASQTWHQMTTTSPTQPLHLITTAPPTQMTTAPPTQSLLLMNTAPPTHPLHLITTAPPTQFSYSQPVSFGIPGQTTIPKDHTATSPVGGISWQTPLHDRVAPPLRKEAEKLAKLGGIPMTSHSATISPPHAMEPAASQTVTSLPFTTMSQRESNSKMISDRTPTPVDDSQAEETVRGKSSEWLPEKMISENTFSITNGKSMDAQSKSDKFISATKPNSPPPEQIEKFPALDSETLSLEPTQQPLFTHTSDGDHAQGIPCMTLLQDRKGSVAIERSTPSPEQIKPSVEESVGTVYENSATEDIQTQATAESALDNLAGEASSSRNIVVKPCEGKSIPPQELNGSQISLVTTEVSANNDKSISDIVRSENSTPPKLLPTHIRETSCPDEGEPHDINTIEYKETQAKTNSTPLVEEEREDSENEKVNVFTMSTGKLSVSGFENAFNEKRHAEILNILVEGTFDPPIEIASRHASNESGVPSSDDELPALLETDPAFQLILEAIEPELDKFDRDDVKQADLPRLIRERSEAIEIICNTDGKTLSFSVSADLRKLPNYQETYDKTFERTSEDSRHSQQSSSCLSDSLEVSEASDDVFSTTDPYASLQIEQFLKPVGESSPKLRQESGNKSYNSITREDVLTQATAATATRELVESLDSSKTKLLNFDDSENDFNINLSAIENEVNSSQSDQAETTEGVLDFEHLLEQTTGSQSDTEHMNSNSLPPEPTEQSPTLLSETDSPVLMQVSEVKVYDSNATEDTEAQANTGSSPPPETSKEERVTSESGASDGTPPHEQMEQSAAAPELTVEGTYYGTNNEQIQGTVIRESTPVQEQVELTLDLSPTRTSQASDQPGNQSVIEESTSEQEQVEGSLSPTSFTSMDLTQTKQNKTADDEEAFSNNTSPQDTSDEGSISGKILLPDENTPSPELVKKSLTPPQGLMTYDNYVTEDEQFQVTASTVPELNKYSHVHTKDKAESSEDDQTGMSEIEMRINTILSPVESIAENVADSMGDDQIELESVEDIRRIGFENSNIKTGQHTIQMANQRTETSWMESTPPSSLEGEASPSQTESLTRTNQANDYSNTLLPTMVNEIPSLEINLKLDSQSGLNQYYTTPGEEVRAISPLLDMNDRKRVDRETSDVEKSTPSPEQSVGSLELTQKYEGTHHYDNSITDDEETQANAIVEPELSEHSHVYAENQIESTGDDQTRTSESELSPHHSTNTTPPLRAGGSCASLGTSEMFANSQSENLNLPINPPVDGKLLPLQEKDFLLHTKLPELQCCATEVDLQSHTRCSLLDKWISNNPQGQVDRTADWRRKIFKNWRDQHTTQIAEQRTDASSDSDEVGATKPVRNQFQKVINAVTDNVTRYQTLSGYDSNTGTNRDTNTLSSETPRESPSPSPEASDSSTTDECDSSSSNVLYPLRMTLPVDFPSLNTPDSSSSEEGVFKKVFKAIGSMI